MHYPANKNFVFPSNTSNPSGLVKRKLYHHEGLNISRWLSISSLIFFNLKVPAYEVEFTLRRERKGGQTELKFHIFSIENAEHQLNRLDTILRPTMRWMGMECGWYCHREMGDSGDGIEYSNSLMSSSLQNER